MVQAGLGEGRSAWLCEPLKHPPLFAPIYVPDDRAEVSLSHTRDLRQKQNLFLNVGGKVE